MSFTRRRGAVEPGQTVRLLPALPDAAWAEPRKLIVLAHGAGGDMDSPLIAYLCDALPTYGVATARFNFLYTEQGRRAADRRPRLEACCRAGINALQNDRTLSGSDSLLAANRWGAALHSMPPLPALRRTLSCSSATRCIRPQDPKKFAMRICRALPSRCCSLVARRTACVRCLCYARPWNACALRTSSTSSTKAITPSRRRSEPARPRMTYFARFSGRWWAGLEISLRRSFRHDPTRFTTADSGLLHPRA